MIGFWLIVSVLLNFIFFLFISAAMRDLRYRESEINRLKKRVLRLNGGYVDWKV